MVHTQSLPPPSDEKEDESDVEGEETDSHDTDHQDDHDRGVVSALTSGWRG